ncbi:MAG: hypothetical protein HY720_01605 [Planctomycetes bacterium]|nr:hypothetical protein [Planctomycetota bacterium]
MDRQRSSPGAAHTRSGIFRALFSRWRRTCEECGRRIPRCPPASVPVRDRAAAMASLDAGDVQGFLELLERAKGGARLEIEIRACPTCLDAGAWLEVRAPPPPRRGPGVLAPRRLRVEGAERVSLIWFLAAGEGAPDPKILAGSGPYAIEDSVLLGKRGQAIAWIQRDAPRDRVSRALSWSGRALLAATLLLLAVLWIDVGMRGIPWPLLSSAATVGALGILAAARFRQRRSVWIGSPDAPLLMIEWSRKRAAWGAYFLGRSIGWIAPRRDGESVRVLDPYRACLAGTARPEKNEMPLRSTAGEEIGSFEADWGGKLRRVVVHVRGRACALRLDPAASFPPALAIAAACALGVLHGLPLQRVEPRSARE